jgi:hypothetical protein
MGPESILLEVVRGGREGTYRFECPTCMEPVQKRADRKIVALLVSAGVGVAGRDVPPVSELMEEPASAADPDDPRGTLPRGPSFTIDDVIDFHFRLQDERYIERFLASQ